MCKVLNVSQSGYYAWRKRPESPRSREDRRLEAKIRVLFKENRNVYGSHLASMQNSRIKANPAARTEWHVL